MYLDRIFAAWKLLVDEVLREFDAVLPTTDLTAFVRDELAEIGGVADESALQARHLRQLYELRARHLDWELGTGFLGFFSPHVGTRYAFLRRIECILEQLPARGDSLNVLEIGCGAGLLSLELASRFQAVIGIDVSPYALRFANALKRRSRTENVSFLAGDAEMLMFADQSFDLVICSEVLEHLIAPDKALSEIQRVLRKGGAAILTTPCAVSPSDLCMNALRLFHTRIEAEKDLHVDKKTYLALKRQGRNIPKTACIRVHLRFRYQELLKLFSSAGFRVEQATGAVFAFPPHSQLFYRYCPGFLLPLIRLGETVLNAMNIFQRFGSLTTCFQLKKR